MVPAAATASAVWPSETEVSCGDVSAEIGHVSQNLTRNGAPFRRTRVSKLWQLYYLKQKGMWSNVLKQRPRWSITRYPIKRVEGDVGDMPRYDLEADSSNAMYTHDMLTLANVSESVPGDIIARPRTYYRDKVVAGDSSDSDDDDLVFYSSFPLPERGARAIVDSDSD